MSLNLKCFSGRVGPTIWQGPGAFSGASVTEGAKSDYFLGSLEKQNQEVGEHNTAATNTVIKSVLSFSDIHNDMAADCVAAVASSFLHLHEQSHHDHGLLKLAKTPFLNN